MAGMSHSQKLQMPLSQGARQAHMKQKRGKRNPQRPSTTAFAGGRISKRAGKRGSKRGKRY